LIWGKQKKKQETDLSLAGLQEEEFGPLVGLPTVLADCLSLDLFKGLVVSLPHGCHWLEECLIIIIKNNCYHQKKKKKKKHKRKRNKIGGTYSLAQVFILGNVRKEGLEFLGHLSPRPG